MNWPGGHGCSLGANGLERNLETMHFVTNMPDIACIPSFGGSNNISTMFNFELFFISN